ncbi:MAG TPA: P-II family nitrogen regulator [Acidimicrobiales bacterium]|jgi:nitrogen regulatory protein P-II 1|nr:P-II family nitrogen regulator [Acidimicrobiales bacterium]
MKLVTAILNPGGLDEVRSRVRALGVSGMTITEAHGVGHEAGHAEVYRGAEYEVDFVPRLRVEILVDDEDADRVTETIAQWATTGHVGDGKVWVTHVESAVRISTGERDAAAV